MTDKLRGLGGDERIWDSPLRGINGQHASGSKFVPRTKERSNSLYDPGDKCEGQIQGRSGVVQGQTQGQFPLNQLKWIFSS